MAITDDIKRQRLDAVSHGETTAQIRSFLGSGAGASSKALVTRSQHAGLASPGPLLAAGRAMPVRHVGNASPAPSTMPQRRYPERSGFVPWFRHAKPHPTSAF